MNSTRQIRQSVARVYGDVNENMDHSWYEYEDLQIVHGSQNHYEIVRKVGQGRYSEVFEGLNTITEKECILKVLKPIKKKRINREIKILQNLAGGPNIIQLIDVLYNPETEVTSLVTEHVYNADFRTLHPRFTENDVRFYMLELLKALDYCHSKGIMHRDVKPQNVMINPERRTLRLIDWGLADFYHLKREYSVRVASPFHKAPELLVDFRQYDYSLDMWSFGCIFAAIIFRKEPFFHGHDNCDILKNISKVLGTEELHEYLERYNIQLDAECDAVLGRPTYPRKPWTRFVTTENQKYISIESIDLLDNILRYDPQERLTALESQLHTYFDKLRPNQTEGAPLH